MEEVLNFLIKQSLTLILSGVVAWLINELKEQRKQAVEIQEQMRNENEALKKGVQLILGNELLRSYDHYEQKGQIPYEAYKHILEMYACYEVLDGNGIVKNMVEHKLPKLQIVGVPQL